MLVQHSNKSCNSIVVEVHGGDGTPEKSVYEAGGDLFGGFRLRIDFQR